MPRRSPGSHNLLPSDVKPLDNVTTKTPELLRLTGNEGNSTSSSCARPGDVTVPTQWYNIAADLPEPIPPQLNPATGAPFTPAELEELSYESKPYRRFVMELYGGQVHSSPSSRTATGRAILSRDADTPGSLRMAVRDAVEVALAEPRARYALGSALNHISLQQKLVRQEAVAQLYEYGEAIADVVIGGVGGLSGHGQLDLPAYQSVLSGTQR